MSQTDKQLADTLIKKVLDNEGLFTVVSGLKPMSSVTELYLKITTADTLRRGDRRITDTTSEDLKKLKRYQQIVNSLNFGDLKFMISPYRITQKDSRPIQITVNRRSLVDSLLKAEQSFFGQFGFVPGTSPEILVNTTEYEHKYNRFRAYGYLFGYPEHAVDFFTVASISNDKTGVFVKRDFFQIPVFSAIRGHFVYAVPQGYKPDEVDSTILNRAKFYLLQYEKVRKKFQRADGSVEYYKLLKKLIKNAA
ncbi:hypothetical protein [Pedobacter lithocola]|uniref:hypothetical protein n=1 Tax=Pedobacter lithocola TaxID=1908239 RepID=UPI003670B022